ncbi:MAG: glycosyltransferase, partial [Acidimicrobiales bacterium]
MSTEPRGPVVVLVAAWESAGSVGRTVAALLRDERVGRVVVVDDGSRDATAEVAAAAGAEVIRLPANRGKGGAVAAGLEASPDAAIYLLVDADVGATAAAAVDLVGPVIDGRADLVIGTLPDAAGTGGLGLVRRVAQAGIRRGSGVSVVAPLSGQRAVRAELLRGLCLAPRFGLETAMTLDSARAGARILEVPVAMAHRGTGRGPAGFAHRGRQGGDVVRALWPRLTSVRARAALIVAVVCVALAAESWSVSRPTVASAPLGPRVAHVVVVGLPNLGLAEAVAEDTRRPALRRLLREGAVGALNVRTLSRDPSEEEGWTTVGAGARAVSGAAGALAYPAGAPLEGGVAADALARRLGLVGADGGGPGPAADGRPGPRAVAVVGAPAVARANAGRHLTSPPGSLGQALRDAGRRAAVVGRAPAAQAVMERSGVIDRGALSGSVVGNVEAALPDSDVVAVGLGRDAPAADAS